MSQSWMPPSVYRIIAGYLREINGLEWASDVVQRIISEYLQERAEMKLYDYLFSPRAIISMNLASINAQDLSRFMHLRSLTIGFATVHDLFRIPASVTHLTIDTFKQLESTSYTMPNVTHVTFTDGYGYHLELFPNATHITMLNWSADKKLIVPDGCQLKIQFQCNVPKHRQMEVLPGNVPEKCIEILPDADA